MTDLKSILPKFSDKDLKSLIENAKEYACIHGILKYTLERRIVPLQHTLFPSPFPRFQFHEAISLQCIFNRLYFYVSEDYNFLSTVVKPAIFQDEYLAALWRLYECDHKLGSLQSLKLALSRSDYMINTKEQGWPLKQVEYNLIASSFGGITEHLAAQHHMILSQFQGLVSKTNFPANPSASGFGRAMSRAVAEYTKLVTLSYNSHPCSPPAILVVVEEGETNIFDQRSLEAACLRENPRIPILRRTFAQLARATDSVQVDLDNRLWVDGTEIALIYYRTGYTPHQFDEEAWETKLTLERTMAIKCPSIAYMLANTKLVQTALAQPNVLQRFISDKEECSRVAATFARQSFVSTAFGDISPETVVNEFITECLRKPSEYVLKPQREGGGNNIFGADISKKLAEIRGQPEANAFILMERLHPPTVENCVVAIDYSPPLRRPMTSELGIYGVLLTLGDKVLENYDSGHLLRSKFAEVDEGGVATGYACLDTPYLV